MSTRKPTGNGDEPSIPNSGHTLSEDPVLKKRSDARKERMLAQLGLLPLNFMKHWAEMMSGFGVPYASVVAAAAFPSTMPEPNRYMTTFPLMAQHYSSCAKADELWADDAPPGKMMEYTDTIRTHNTDGSLNHIISDDLVPYFEHGKEEYWPQLLLTANHAMTDKTKDVSGIMDNIAAFMKQTLGDRFELLRIHNRSEPDANAHELHDIQGKTIEVAAIATQSTYEKNAASVLRRHRFLCDNRTESLANRMEPKGPAGEYEKIDDSGQKIDLRGPSKGAVRLAKLMLKLMLEEPDTLDQTLMPDDKKWKFVDETRSLQQMERDGDLAHLTKWPVLRNDAVEVAKHITLIGYSMGAQTVTDAVRYLAFELSSKDLGCSAIFSKRTNTGQTAALTRQDVADIISNIGLVAMAGPAVPITQEERELGIRRLLITSKKDLISYHLVVSGLHDVVTRIGRSFGTVPNLFKPFRMDEHASDHDIRCSVNGTDAEFGHSPTEALESQEVNGTKKPWGYISEDPRAMEEFRNMVAWKYKMPGYYPPSPSLGIAA